VLPRNVRTKITRIEYQSVGEDEPHRTEYHPEGIVRILGDADTLLMPEG
jgi:hypothetical protein